MQYLSELLITSIPQARINSFLIGSMCLCFISWQQQEKLAAYAATFPIPMLSNIRWCFLRRSKEKSPFFSASPRIFLEITKDRFWVVLLEVLCSSSVKPQASIRGELYKGYFKADFLSFPPAMVPQHGQSFSLCECRGTHRLPHSYKQKVKQIEERSSP